MDLFDFDDSLPSGSVRHANYALNQTKQTTKIVEDAAIDDYSVSINNSDQNITIKCSSGFYLQVAKPCFTTLKDGSVMNKASIAISLDDVKVTLDKNNVEATHLLHFSFMSNMSSCGGVRVHLHHSTCTIQMQGSHVMPDKTRAPVWFLNAIVLNKFKDLAKV